jgi:putative flippase GtrA
MAATNSYFWNKFWVFQDSGDNVFADLPKFSLVILSGTILNSGLVIFFTTFVGPQFGIGANEWLNISKVTASATTLIWNFLGYKFFAFNGQNNKNAAR